MINSNNPSAIRSQREIKKALIVLMRKYQYKDITVKQIILESKLSRKTFYRNYNSKDDVLISLVKKSLEDYFSIVNNEDVDILSTIFSFVVKNKELLFLLDKNDMLYVVLQYINRYGFDYREKHLSSSNPFTQLFDNLDSNYLVALNCGAILNVVALWVHQGMKDSPDSVRATISEYLSRLKQSNIKLL
jgi:AcrR family transcriptional regulator